MQEYMAQINCYDNDEAGDSIEYTISKQFETAGDPYVWLEEYISDNDRLFAHVDVGTPFITHNGEYVKRTETA